MIASSSMVLRPREAYRRQHRRIRRFRPKRDSKVRLSAHGTHECLLTPGNKQKKLKSMNLLLSPPALEVSTKSNLQFIEGDEVLSFPIDETHAFGHVDENGNHIIFESNI